MSDTLEENYNEGQPARTLMGGGDHRKECVVACVALNWQTQTLETFDTHNPRYKDWDLIQFLTASSDAPVYFTTPFTVMCESHWIINLSSFHFQNNEEGEATLISL